MSEVKRHVCHYRSKKVIGGYPLLPSVEEISEGELAVNYAEGVETLITKNSVNEIVTFPNRNVLRITDVGKVPSLGYPLVVCETSSGGVLGFVNGDIPIAGVSMRVVVHNTNASKYIKLSLPTDDPYVVVGDYEFLLDYSGYAWVDVVSDGKKCYLAMNSCEGDVTLGKDVCLYDNENDRLVVVGAEDWSIQGYPSDRYTPIGIVVIPASHNLYDCDKGEEECAIMSLKAMSCSTPDEGTSKKEESIYWGQSTGDLSDLPNGGEFPCTGQWDNPYNISNGSYEDDVWTVKGQNASGYLPTDYFENDEGSVRCPNDLNAWYPAIVTYSTYNVLPSPYDDNSENGRNEAYYSTKVTNALGDFKGKEWTANIMGLDVVTEDKWNGETITNSIEEGYFPPVFCCHRYEVSGVNIGDWYLPSVGEMGYVAARYQVINNSIQAVKDKFTGYSSMLLTGDYWTSTEGTLTQAGYATPSNGYVRCNSDKTNTHSVRAFYRTSVVNNANVGDILIYYVEGNSYMVVASGGISGLDSDKYVPVGVVVIPSSHDVYGTGECAVISLVNMSLTSPSSGVTTNSTMMWGDEVTATGNKRSSGAARFGYYTVDKDKVVSDIVENDSLGSVSIAYLPTDNSAYTENKLGFDSEKYGSDTGVKYFIGGEPSGSDKYLFCSPFLTDGSRNELFSDASQSSFSANFDGKVNTEIMLGHATAQADWKTDETIKNSYSTGYFPSACCCWRYHTDGTEQGDWYLPACGEAAYAVVRYMAIKDTFTKLLVAYGSDCGSTWGNGYHYNSTERASTTCIHIGNYTGFKTSVNKEAGYAIHPYLRLNPKTGVVRR